MARRVHWRRVRGPEERGAWTVEHLRSKEEGSMTKYRPLMIALVVAVLGMMVATSSNMAQAQQPPAQNPFKGIPVTGGGPDGTFVGSFSIEKFVVERNNGRRQLYAVGDLTGVLTAPDGVVTNKTFNDVKMPASLDTGRGRGGGNNDDVGDERGSDSAEPPDTLVATQAASCPILFLVLGPLDLNLLGLRVELNQVRLNITAVPGPGNLLGNLLCAVAGLLDGVNLNSRLQQIADLLNAILALFG
jgi:hypothetical protein